MTSTSKIDESLKSKIRSLVKQVVTTQHTDPNKRMLKEMPGRLSLACPYCGDSHTDTYKREAVSTGIVYNITVLTVANMAMFTVY